MTDDDAHWITGIGGISPLGADFSQISASLLAGRSAIRPVTGFDVADHPCQIAGQQELPPSPAELAAETYAGLTPIEQCVSWCCVQALTDAGLWRERTDLRVGLVLGFAAEWMLHWDHDYRQGGHLIFDTQPRKRATVDTVAEVLALRGPRMSIAAACASGNHALSQACNWLQMGWVDVCLAGACDVGVTPYSLGSFGNLRALSRRNDDPPAAVRPFDRDRDGMVIGEGGAVFVLELSDHARRRQRDAYAEVAGIGMTSDAHHLVIPSPDPANAVAAMRAALAAARVNPQDVDYVNAHATSTLVGDACEARILRDVFGPYCGQVPVSSTKSMTGHLLCAAAAIEALACLGAIKQQALPPTINLDHPDPECALCHVANVAQERPVRVAVSNSFGFGGHNTALVLKAVA